MPLMRYQIRNQYGLADKELYRPADRDDPEALLEGVAMAGLVGILRQLGDLAEFAAEIFRCLHEELMATAARGHGLMIRLQQLEAEFPSVEKAVLSQTDNSSSFSDPGLDWHPYLRTEENLIARGDLPRCIMDSYEECRGPPRLFLLDKFDVAGAGSCLKRYSDPSLLKTRTVSELATSNIWIVKKSRKLKKKRSWGMDEKAPEAASTSHAKLHQLFLMEHVESGHRDPRFHVKLKRRQLNGSRINSRSERSYMEKLVKSPSSSPYHETAPESRLKLRFHTLRNDNASESGTLDKSTQEIETEVKVCNVQEVLPTPSMVNSNSGNTGKDLEKEPQSVADDEGVEIPFTPQKSTNKEKPVTNLEGVPESCLEMSYSLLTSTVDNYTDVPASMKPETTETEVDKSNDLGYLGVGEPHTSFDASETQTGIPAWFFNVLHHSLEEEESNILYTDFSSSSPESKPPNTEESAETADVSFVQPSVNKSAGMETPELEETPFTLASCENPQNLPQDTGSYLQLCSEQLKADEFGLKLSETSAVSEVGRGTMLNIPPEAHQEYLSELPQAPPEAEETRTAVLLTNYTDDCDTENVCSVETESVISFSVLMDDQFYSLTNQEMEILKPESVSSEIDVFLSAAESTSKATPVTLESDKVLPTRDVGAANGFEDLSLVAIAHDDTIAEEDETNSENRCSMNNKTGNLVSPSGISSKDSTLMPDADLKTGREHLVASLSRIDPLLNPDQAGRPSYSEQEDMQTVSMVADDSDSKETMPKNNADTLSCEASFFSDADHNQTGLSNIALETMHKTDLSTSTLPDSICYQRESLSGTQECHSSEYCSWSWDQGQESPLGHASVDPIAPSAESLPSDVTVHEVSVGLHDLSSVEPATAGSNGCLESDTESSALACRLQNSEKTLPSGLTELEALHAAQKESSTSFDDRCSEPMLSMDHTDQENCLDISPESVPPCNVSLYKETQAGPEDTPPLPPLPPTQWWIGKLIESVKTIEAPFPSVASLESIGKSSVCVHMGEYTVQAASIAVNSTLNKTEKATEALFPSLAADRKSNDSGHTGDNTPNGSVKMTEAPFSSVASFAAGESHSIHVHASEVTLQAASAADWGSEIPEIEHFKRSSGGCSNPQPAISMSQRTIVEEKSEIGKRGPEGETKIPDAFKPSRTLRDKNSYENPVMEELSGHKASLGNVVVAIDRSMLRKASERARPPVGPRVNEQDSLLEVIRSKSFNLRPAVTPARPNVQAAPTTNLRIAAILEKANSLRQAMAGSDDDDDSDNWSDS